MSLWAFRFVLFYLAILLVQPQNRFPFLWPWRIALVCMIVAAVLHVVSSSSERRPLLRFGPATITALFVLVFSFISQQVGVFQASSNWNANIDIIFKNSICLILIEAMATTVERVWAVFGTIVLATLWWIKAGLRLSSVGATYAGDRLWSPAVSLIDNPNSFAFMMALMIPIYLYFFQNTHAKMLKLFFLFCALSAVYITLQTGSRTGLLCLIAAGVLLIPKYWKSHKASLATIIFVVFAFTGSIGALNIERYKTVGESIKSFLSNEYVEKDPSQMTQDEQSAWERKMKNRHSWALIKAYPVFGVGVNKRDDLIPDDYYYARGQVHNEWLYIGVQMGFMGMFLYLMFQAIILVVGMRVQAWATPHWPALADLGWMLKYLFGVYIVGGAFSPVGWNPLLMAIAGTASALWLNIQNKSWNKATEIA